MTNELAYLDATAQAELVRRGEITPIELVDAAIARVEKVNPQLNAVITPLFDKARAQAKSGTIPAGPFRGVPFLLKDLVCASGGDPLHDGMRLLKEARYVAPHDTYLAAKFRAAGFLCIGKTNTPELGLNGTTEPEAYGPTRNPWNPNHSTGGSSGGSAAAVAAGMVPVAHANDGGGSIRIPASECGLVGLKPSRGRVSLGPDTGDFWHGLAIEGVVSRLVQDTAAVLDAIDGNMPGDPYAAPPKRRPFVEEVGANPGRLRIGLMRRTPTGGAPLHADCIAAVESAARLLTSLGHSVEEAHPAALDEHEYLGHFSTVVACHTVQVFEEIGRLVGKTITKSDVELWTWNFAEPGQNIAAAQYLAAIRWLQVWTRRVAQWWADGFDLLLTPTIAEPPPPLGVLVATPDNPTRGFERLFALMPFTPPYNVTGQPAVSLPLHWNAAGLPIGTQLVAAMGREDLLIQIASQLEQARPWKDQRPPIHA
ncbi:MAG TPA: amidase family protein [Candidatus Binatia bacterium]|jgi:amidase|nr:amidase family protein [Candidatus Binatia bacterium]